MTSNTVYNPTCSVCGKRMGDMSGDEFTALVLAEGLGAKCFDCNPVVSDVSPELFWCWEPGDLFVLGDTSFMIAEHFGNGGEMFVIPPVQPHARARSCLSSSTYLNTSSKNPRAYLDRVADTFICPECEIGITERMGDAWHCDTCGHCEVIRENIILPSWVITPSSTGSECPDCIYVRGFPGGEIGPEPKKYCDYHHALLIEQHEDGSMGWENG